MVQVNIKKLIDEVQCYQTVRELRWPEGILCPSCQSKEVIKRGFDDTEPARQRYECHGCNRRFDDLTEGSVLKVEMTAQLRNLTIFKTKACELPRAVYLHI
jgi:transposase-like protein